MSESMAAEIWIGGKIPRSLVSELCAQVSAENLSLEWGDAGFSPDSAEELLEALDDRAAGGLLHLHDDEARWGRFESLEVFLENQGIAYRRRSEGKWEYDPELVEFRSGAGLVRYATDHSGEPLVLASDLKAIEASLAGAIERLACASAKQTQRRLQKILQRLRELQPSRLPLEPLEIVESEPTLEAAHG